MTGLPTTHRCMATEAGATRPVRVVGDAREAPPQLDRGREFAPLLVDGADGSLVLFGDDEHRWSMGTLGVADRPRGASPRPSIRSSVFRWSAWRSCLRRADKAIQQIVDLLAA